MDVVSRREKERRAREEAIINAAEKVFSSTGYNETSMEEIAKESQFTRKTIYQYFTDKEDLYFAVIIRGFQTLLRYFQEDIKKGNTGFENLQGLASAYYRFYKDFPKTFNLMSYVGYIKSSNNNITRRQTFNEINSSIVNEVAKVIEQGKIDGSIRKDLDTMSITYSAEFLITGFFHMLSVSGKTFTEHFALNQSDFIKFNISLLCDAFRAKNSKGLSH
ncbi:MAG: TetR/AcrR family transcriptional regulator [Bacillota bacterium]|nr:TetR/AcrR family transcriptional regulator [Bacillota bacterium]